MLRAHIFSKSRSRSWNSEVTLWSPRVIRYRRKTSLLPGMWHELLSTLPLKTAHESDPLSLTLSHHTGYFPYGPFSDGHSRSAKYLVLCDLPFSFKSGDPISSVFSSNFVTRTCGLLLFVMETKFVILMKYQSHYLFEYTFISVLNWKLSGVLLFWSLILCRAYMG